MSWRAWLNGLVGGKPHKEESVSITGFELRVVNGKVVTLRKNGRDVDPESEEGKILVEAGRRSLDDGMARFDQSMADMDARLKEIFE